MTWGTAWLVMILTAASPGEQISQADGISEFTSKGATFGDAAGTWVEYELVDPGRRRKVRFSVVEDRLPDGSTHRFFEIWMTHDGDVSMKVELKPDGTLSDKARLRMPFGIEWSELPKDRKPCSTCGGELAGPQTWASIKTPAGVFRSVKLSGKKGGKVGYFWKSPDVPLLGVVRIDLATGRYFEVVAIGNDAKTAIPEDAPVHAAGTIQKRFEGLSAAMIGLTPLGDGGVGESGGGGPAGDGGSISVRQPADGGVPRMEADGGARCDGGPCLQTYRAP